MSARREARQNATASSAQGAMPAPFLLGPCIEVWAEESPKADPGRRSDEDGLTAAWWSARRRFADAREAWLDARGITEMADRCLAFPPSAIRPWSAGFLLDGDRASDVFRRFARAGRSPEDIRALRREADRLTALSKEAR